MDTGKSNPASAAAAGKSGEDYNGATTDKYSWTQTLSEVDMKIPISSNIRKGKDVVVTIGTETLTILRKTNQGDPVILTGEFTFPVNKEESYWNLLPGEYISIFLQKTKGRWWTAVLKDENPIDPASIQAEVPMEDLQHDEQMKIEELMWEQHQKLSGQSVCKEEKNLETILKNAWDIEGSPFKGTPYNPCLVNFANTMDISNLEDTGNK